MFSEIVTRGVMVDALALVVFVSACGNGMDKHVASLSPTRAPTLTAEEEKTFNNRLTTPGPVLLVDDLPLSAAEGVFGWRPISATAAEYTRVDGLSGLERSTPGASGYRLTYETNDGTQLEMVQASEPLSIFKDPPTDARSVVAGRFSIVVWHDDYQAYARFDTGALAAGGSPVVAFVSSTQNDEEQLVAFVASLT